MRVAEIVFSLQRNEDKSLFQLGALTAKENSILLMVGIRLWHSSANEWSLARL